VEEEDTPLPPSFHQTITEESLCNNDTPYVFWVTLHIPILPVPMDPVSTMFEHLKKFITQMLEEDTHFTTFPYNLSKVESKEDLLEPINNPDVLPDNVDEWL